MTQIDDDVNDEERLEKLPEDYEPPFSPAEVSRDESEPADSDLQPRRDLDDTHPDTDDGIDEQEEYDEGLSGAAGVDDPED